MGQIVVYFIFFNSPPLVYKNKNSSIFQSIEEKITIYTRKYHISKLVNFLYICESQQVSKISCRSRNYSPIFGKIIALIPEIYYEFFFSQHRICANYFYFSPHENKFDWMHSMSHRLHFFKPPPPWKKKIFLIQTRTWKESDEKIRDEAEKNVFSLMKNISLMNSLIKHSFNLHAA